MNLLNSAKALLPRLFASHLIWGLTFFAWSATASPLYADYEVYAIHTVEWLVDNSDVIAVVANTASKEERSKVVHVFKGDANQIVFPLQKIKKTSCSYWEPQSRGSVRLLFVRGESELLQAVKLVRPITMGSSNDLSIENLAFGISQYGSLLLTENLFLEAIRARIQAGPGHPPAKPPSERTREGTTFLQAPKDFPFETTQQTIMLVVPFTTERRDHFIKILQTGNAAARIMAITELAYFDDEKATQAIRQASKVTKVTPAFSLGGWNTLPGKVNLPITAQEVRAAAQAALAEKEAMKVTEGGN